MSTDSISYYDRAAFRHGVDVLIGDRRAVFTYDLVSFDVDYNEPSAPYVEQLCNALARADGVAPPTLSEDFGGFFEHAVDLLDTFDSLGFLTEVGRPRPDATVTGAVFWKQVRSFATTWQQRASPVLYPALASRAVPRGALLRYALEYLHVVKAGPAIIAGMLAHVDTPSTHARLTEFVVQELGHDRLLRRALSAAAVDPAEQERLPLPETFAVISGLQTIADQDPLSFKCAAFLLEQANPEFHAALRDAAEATGLGHEFWGPIVEHSDINDDGDHGSISETLLADVEVVTIEQRRVALKHVAYLIDSLVALEHAVLDPANALHVGR